MLNKLGAILLVAGLILPYRYDVTPITGAWKQAATALVVGLPMLAAIVYALHVLVPALARFHARYSGALHGLLRALYFILVGSYLLGALQSGGTRADRLFPLMAIALTGSLVAWQQGRGTKALRLPLLLLAIVGLPLVTNLLGGLHTGDLRFGAWIFTAGYALAATLEVRDLRGAGRVTHGG